MFRDMRRTKQLLSEEKSVEVLNKATSGVLAVSGDDNYPYAVPLSYVYNNNKIYFHCAKKGHKIDAITNNSKVSFCVVDKDEVVPEEYTTYFRSVIVFGKAKIIEDVDEKRFALEILSKKYSPDHNEGSLKEIEKFFNQVCVLELTIEHISGKEAIELIKQL